LAGTTAFAAALALLFWNQLRESNKLTASLQQQVEALTDALNQNPGHRSAGDATPQPAVASVTTDASVVTMASVAAPAPPVAQAVAGDANAPAPIPQSGCVDRLTRARENAADAMEEWAVELKLTPDETQRLTQIRQDQLLARSTCAAVAASSTEQENLRLRFWEALGPIHLAQVVELNAGRTTQNYMSYLAKQFRDQDMPLTDEQVRQLSPIYLEENRRIQLQEVRRISPPGPQARLSYEEELLRLVEERLVRIQAAQSWLRPEQMEQLRSIAKTEIASRRSSVQAVRELLQQGRGVPPQPLPAIVTVRLQR
jgi:hypothetical protein